jgi:hypothetical protein
MNILAEMTRNGLTREDVAKKLNLSLPSFRKRLTGQIDFKLSEINTLISLFGNNVSFEYLFER